MTPKFLIKLAKEQQEQVQPQKMVEPLAQIKAMQLGLDPALLQTNMNEALRILTNKLKNNEIKTAGWLNNVAADPVGAVNRFAALHTIKPINDNLSKMFKVLYSPWVQGVGVQGACDAMAYIRSILDSNVIKGKGQKVLSETKHKDFTNLTTPGSTLKQ